MSNTTYTNYSATPGGGGNSLFVLEGLYQSINSYFHATSHISGIPTITLNELKIFNVVIPFTQPDMPCNQRGLADISIYTNPWGSKGVF